MSTTPAIAIPIWEGVTWGTVMDGAADMEATGIGSLIVVLWPAGIIAPG